jgi:hypothetical protein
MRHIESSVRIKSALPLEAAVIKQSLLTRLRAAFHVETVGEGVNQFSVAATGKATSYVFSLGVTLRTDDRGAGILIEGKNEVSLGMRVFYLLALLMVLGLTLLPLGGEEAKKQGDLILEAMFFLVVGGFIIYDMNKKMDEPQGIIDRLLKSVSDEFSS